MSSSSNLLNLVTQLQSMEMSFTSVLMEAAMKLGAITDANIFVLVETADGGRKISGKRHLCDAYLSGNLTPTGQDVELEVNPLVSALRERPSSTHLPETYTGTSVFPSASSMPRDNHDVPSTSAHSSAPFTNAFRTSGYRPASSRDVRLANGFPRKRPGESPQRTLHNAKVPKPSCSSASSELTPRYAEEETVSVNVKEENESPTPAVECEYHLDGTISRDDRSDDDDVGIISDLFGMGADHVASQKSNPLSIVPWRNSPTMVPGPNSSSAVVGPSVSIDGAVDYPFNHSYEALTQNIDFSKLEETLAMDVSADKLEALQTLPPREIFLKGTVGYRVLNSVMYEIGRSIAQACASLGLTSPKDPESKTIFSSCFDKWIAENLAHLATSEKKLENLSRSPLGYMKQNARVHFYKVFSTLLKDRRKGGVRDLHQAIAYR